MHQVHKKTLTPTSHQNRRGNDHFLKDFSNTCRRNKTLFSDNEELLLSNEKLFAKFESFTRPNTYKGTTHFFFHLNILCGTLLLTTVRHIFTSADFMHQSCSIPLALLHYVCSIQTGKHTDIPKVKIQAKSYFQPRYDFPEDNGR